MFFSSPTSFKGKPKQAPPPPRIWGPSPIWGPFPHLGALPPFGGPSPMWRQPHTFALLLHCEVINGGSHAGNGLPVQDTSGGVKAGCPRDVLHCRPKKGSRISMRDEFLHVCLHFGCEAVPKSASSLRAFFRLPSKPSKRGVLKFDTCCCDCSCVFCYCSDSATEKCRRVGVCGLRIAFGIWPALQWHTSCQKELSHTLPWHKEDIA